MILIITCDFKYATSSYGQLLNSGASAMFDTWKIFVLTSFSWQCVIQTCYSSLKTSRLQPDTVMLKCDILHSTLIKMQFILFECVFTLSSFCLSVSNILDRFSLFLFAKLFANKLHHTMMAPSAGDLYSWHAKHTIKTTHLEVCFVSWFICSWISSTSHSITK